MRLMNAGYHEPLNLGQDRMITINGLADIIADCAGIAVTRRHVAGPQGVRGRNSDNTRLRTVLGWEPQISLEDGLARTYAWIEDQVRSCARRSRSARTSMPTPSDMVVTPRDGAVRCVGSPGQRDHHDGRAGDHRRMDPRPLAPLRVRDGRSRRHGEPTDDEMRRIHEGAGLVTPDGMPLVWMAHLLGHSRVERVYGPDLLLACCEMSTRRGYRHFFYGGAPGVGERLAARLEARFPGLSVAGLYSPPFRPLTPEEDAALVDRIDAARPDIVWVGLSTPKQERWMAAHVGRLQAPVLVGVGAAFDFHAGVKRQAPRWMRRSGLEWSFRLMTEPRRLG